MSADSFLDSLSGISSLSESPVSTYTMIWLLSHSEVGAGARKYFPHYDEFSRSRQSMPVHYEALGQSAKLFMWVGYPQVQCCPASQRAGCWSTTESKRGRGEERSSRASAEQVTLVARKQNSSSFRKAGEGNQEDFDTFHAVGVSMKKVEREGADWTVRKVCEQHDEAWSRVQFDSPQGSTKQEKVTTVINKYIKHLKKPFAFRLGKRKNKTKAITSTSL